MRKRKDFCFYQSFIVASTLLLATTPNYLDDIEYAINVETSRRSDSLYFVVDSSHRKWMNFSLPSTKSRGTEKPNGKPILCKTESGHWKQYGGGGGEYTSGVVTLREKCRSLFSPSQDFRPLHHHFKSKDSDPSPDFSSLSPGQRPSRRCLHWPLMNTLAGTTLQPEEKKKNK